MTLEPFETQASLQEASGAFADRVDVARHRGMKNALQALRPGLLICDPTTFEIRYANEAAREVLDLETSRVPARLPRKLTVTRQDEGHRRRGAAFFRAEIDGDDRDLRAAPVYAADGKIECVLIVIRDYAGISWSLFEMLDKLPIAVAALAEDGSDIRYINQTAVREIYAGRAGAKPRKGGDHGGVFEGAIAGWWKAAPPEGEGRAVVTAGRLKIDMHFSRLVSDEGEPARLVYWDARVLEPVKN